MLKIFFKLYHSRHTPEYKSQFRKGKNISKTTVQQKWQQVFCKHVCSNDELGTFTTDLYFILLLSIFLNSLTVEKKKSYIKNIFSPLKS